MLKIIFYVPVENCDDVKEALFSVGAGKIGDYDCCSWQVKGEGQFRPLLGAQPYLGQKNKLEKVEEYKVEMVCHEELIEKAIESLKKSHPYEEPAYQVFKVEKY